MVCEEQSVEEYPEPRHSSPECQLGTSCALAEDPGSVSSTHMVADNHLEIQS